MPLSFLALALALAAAAVAAPTAPPHLVFILTDDLGYGIPGFGAAADSGIRIPNIDALRAEGLTLTSAYVYQFCSPSRGSFLTGRYPYKLPQTRCNFLPATIPDGTPLAYSMLPKKLSAAAYQSHHIGKWHLGLYADAFTPLSRGFDSTYGFLTGGEDHLTQAGDVGAKCGNGSTVYDIWSAGAVAAQFQGNYTAYEINDRAVGVIEAHPADAPLFMYLALHNTHAPIQAEQKYLDLYPDVADSLQQRFWAMVSTVDDTVGNVTAALKARGMWDNTLLVWLTDNGSPIQVAGSNAPLRGVKGSNWEGGVRTPAVVSGGLLPPAQRGARSAGVAHIVDWYATFCGLAGVPAADPAGPEPEIDSLDLWPWLSGAAPASPRDAGLTVLDHSMYRNTTTGAIRFGRYKLLVGGSFSSGEAPAAGEWGASWFGAFSPNKTFPGTAFYACPPASPCLFDVVADPAEHNDLAASQPALLADMLERFRALEATYHPPVEGPPAENAELCAAAEASRARNGGKLFVQPWRQP